MRPDVASTVNDCAASDTQDILSTHVSLDLGALSGTASLLVCPRSDKPAAWLDTHGLTVERLQVAGQDTKVEVQQQGLRVPLAHADLPATIEVDYTFSAREATDFDGWMPTQGVSFTWPDYCGNLFPCNPALADGVVFTMDVTGFDPSLTAVYPASTYADAPAYMPAVAVGDYTRVDLGQTGAGTQLYAWHLPGYGDATAEGTAHLVGTFDFFETTYGPYGFGPEAGTVQVDWGPGSFGGMEHHPYWHVGQSDFHVEETQAHEAAHGWFGNGVRIACWEDFVLSEGTTSYLAARGLEAAGGAELWTSYVDDYLAPACNGWDVNTVVLPDQTCNEIDFIHHDVWSLATYMKGACFYEEVADVVGPEALDATLAEFYTTHVGQSARMQEMIDLLLERSDPADVPAIESAVTDWLRTEACPADFATRCKERQPR